ncbi:unnamed protein product [Linum trigynum]|uniref:Large ribosomal subunit protein uL18c n=1 Tax=Linum trigynum TaxID=586398 RepID=A0AAV2C8A9_9ROSI
MGSLATAGNCTEEPRRIGGFWFLCDIYGRLLLFASVNLELWWKQNRSEFLINRLIECGEVIDDSKMHTLAAASTMQKLLAEELNFSSGPTIEVAKKVGEAIAKACLEKGITKVAFDRGGYPYHGRVKALADAARENGLEF